MVQQKTKELIKNTLENSFNLNSFKLFVNNLLNKADLSKNQIISPEEVGSEFKNNIKSCQLLGEYIDKNGKKIHILTVQFNNEGSIERARTFQRNFIAKYLKYNPGIDSSLVAFFQEDSPDWRFSFVKIDLSLTEKGSLKYDFTPARRYSFLVGQNEFSHTAQFQLAPIIENEGDVYISDIEECFHVEKVTKEFFEKYRGLFDRLLKSIDNLIKKDIKIKKEFEDKNIEKEDFAKRILGQIVFLYFLQKKGWLGIEKDQLSKKFKKFGEGDKNFLYNLFKKCKEKDKNFFNDYLEHLFYSALAQDRRADDNQFHLQGIDYKLPFLNGGLFEPIGINRGYNWRETDILISNEIFSNSNGEGILDVFNLYNFTVKEDEPMEKEVAIDPEMLGKVFENLLDTKERKSTGSFYTPREIVHYMCQQSLINYLETNTQIKREIIEKFVSEDNSQDIPKEIIENKFRIDNLLKEIKVVDPAVGSGAFLVGMMSEIIKCRSSLNSGKKIFDLKEECIKNNLYGVDISPGAVDICQLRLWLSLIVDEDEYGNVQPLPNLDYKIMCGNSLIEEYNGMKIWDDKWLGIKIIKPNKLEKIKEIDTEIKNLKSKIPYLINQEEKRKELEKEIKKLEKEKTVLNKGRGENMKLDYSDSERKLIILKKYHEEFTHISDRIKKQEQKKKIEEATIELIKSKLIEENKKDSLKEVEEILQKKRSMPFFLWKMNFIEVFDRENPGFDVVIANPPYLEFDELRLKDSNFIFYRDYFNMKWKFNLYSLFLKKGPELLRDKGIISYIVPNSFSKEKYNADIREDYISNKKIISFVDFTKEVKPVFENASNGSYMVFVVEKTKENNPNIIINEYCNKRFIFSHNINQKELLNSFDYQLNISDNQFILDKLEKDSVSLGEICMIRVGLTPSKPYKKKYGKDYENFKDKFCKDKRLFKFLRRNKGDDGITKYCINHKTDYIIWDREELYKDKVCPGEFEDYYNQKLIFRNRGVNVFGSYDESNIFVNDIFNVVVLKGSYKKDRMKSFGEREIEISKNYSLKYLLSIINSNVILFFLKNKFVFRDIKAPMMKIFPIPKVSKENQKPFIEIVDRILSITGDKDYLENQDKQLMVKELENKIDKMVYELYKLTSEEIKIVKNFNKK